MLFFFSPHILQLWMLILNMAKHSNNKVVCKDNPRKQNTQDSQDLVCQSFFYT